MSIKSRFYNVISKAYDLLDIIWLSKGGADPREVINNLIPNGRFKVLDMCCGTFSNGLPVAKKNPDNIVVGLDRNRKMLQKAKRKAEESGLSNVKLIRRDATATGLKDGSFDYIIIGLALHECDEELRKNILSEAYRLLKKDGRLIILDWERESKLSRRIKFSPLYICETIGTPKYFKEYYNSDKRTFFEQYGFEAERVEKCNYTFVAELRKMNNPAVVGLIDSRYTKRTELLDFDNRSIRELIRARGWAKLPEFERIQAIYDFVRDEIRFGYNIDDCIKASKVLKDGYGQCNTKGTLFMALLRACNIPCRVHGFTIDKKLQKGAMTGFVYKQAPNDIFHSWVEVYLEGTWYELEGFILDKKYIEKLQAKIKARDGFCSGPFCAFGVGVKDIARPLIDFNRNSTYIQSEGINNDFGLYDSPDEMFREHQQKLSPVKRFAFRHYGRHMMNRNVKKIRGNV
ncbi:MAG TPA: hypothetical protein DEO87_01955 [Lachnospiraceae bacterium]|nr:hypothetical protein [Lachnospiraceae bacterium]